MAVVIAVAVQPITLAFAGVLCLVFAIPWVRSRYRDHRFFADRIKTAWMLRIAATLFVAALLWGLLNGWD